MYNKALTFTAACTGMAFVGISFIVIGSVLPALTAKYGLNESDVSYTVTFLPIGVLIGSLIFGPVADRFGYRILLTGSTLIAAIGFMGISLINDAEALPYSIFLIGLGSGMLNGSTNSLVSGIYDNQKRSAKLGILGACYGIGALSMPTLLGILSRHYSYESILLSTGIFMALSVIYFMAIRFPSPLKSKGISFKQLFLLFKQPVTVILSLFLFFQSGIEGLLNNWTAIFLNKTNGIEVGRSIFILTSFVMGMTVARLLLGSLLKHWKPLQTLTAGLFMTAIGIIGLYYTSGMVITAAISLFICGFGLSAGFPVMIGIIGSLHKEMMGTAIGFALFIALTGNSILNYLMKYVILLSGMKSFPLFLALLTVAQAIIILKNKKIINSNF